MHNFDNKEIEARGIPGFPLSYYYVNFFNPRYQMVFHWHFEFEMIFIHKGEFVLHLDENTYKLCKGDIALVNPGVLHGGQAINAEYSCIVFDLELIRHHGFLDDRFIHKLVNHQVRVREILKSNELSDYCQLEYAFSSLLNYFIASKREENAFFVTTMLRIIFSEVERNGLYETDSFSEENGTNKAIPIRRVLEYIEQNYSRTITLEELADVTCLSQKYFCEFFKEATGKTPIDYLNLFRVEKASIMLRDKDLSILSIALACGFSDASYFSRVFKKYNKVKPIEYRRNIPN